jgi:hypothetical protein
MLAEYIYLGNQLLSMIKPGQEVYSHHNDHRRKKWVGPIFQPSVMSRASERLREEMISDQRMSKHVEELDSYFRS